MSGRLRVQVPFCQQSIKSYLYGKRNRVNESYQTVRLFDVMKKGDIYKVPYDKKRHNGIKLEASRRNRDLRLIGVLKNKMDVKFRVSATEYPGFSAIICLK